LKKSLASLFVGLALTSSISVQAAEEKRWFEVEVIIFERLSENSQAKEHWEESDLPTLSKKHIDPFSLFLDEKNLVSYQLAVSASNTLLATSSAVPTNDVIDDVITISEITDINSPEIIEEGDLLAFGDDLSLQASDAINTDNIEAEISKPIIVATKAEIDGAELIAQSQDEEFEIAPASDLQLSEQVQALKQHANYKLLMHSAWRMPPTIKRRAIPIRIFAGQNYQTRFNPDGSPILTPIEEVQEAVIVNDIETNTDTAAVLMTDEDELTPLWQLDGELLIYLDHYLYAETKMYIRQETTREVPVSDVTSDYSTDQQSKEQSLLSLSSLALDVKIANPLVESISELDSEAEIEMQEQAFLQSYPMKQLRVIRSSEIHYFDHPKFGMLMQIRKYEKPDPVIEEDTPRIEN